MSNLRIYSYNLARTRKLWNFFAVSVVVLLSFSLMSCGSSPDENTLDDSESVSGNKFPISVETPFGETSISNNPERIVTLSVSMAANLDSLGLSPLAVAYKTDFEKNQPWNDSSWNFVSDVTKSGNINLEKLADLNPDLILAESYQVTDKNTFEQLSSIAPTVVPISHDSEDPDWEDRFISVGKAVGKDSEIDETLRDLRSDLSNAGKSLKLDGKTYNFIGYASGAFSFGNGSFLELLGMEPANSQDNVVNTEIPGENLPKLDGDYIFVNVTNRDDLEGVETWERIPAVREGNVRYITDINASIAMNTPDILSIGWIIENLEGSQNLFK